MEKSKCAKIIRVVTIAPLMAFAALTVMYMFRPEIFGLATNYFLSVIFLTVIPISAYMLQPHISHLKEQGRNGQRKAAIIMAVFGYIAGLISSLICKAPKTCVLIYLLYFISGIFIVFFNGILKIRASGHACGIVGPLTLLIYFFGGYAAFGLIVFIPVWISSIKLKRHTNAEFVLGSVIPVVSLAAALAIIM